MEDGAFRAREEGTPQGGLVSPLLSNSYLHSVLDLWFEKRFARSSQGKAFFVGFADDLVACFERETDARRFRLELTERLSAFDLDVEPNKTAVLRFGSEAQRDAHQDGRSSPEVVHFLGFTHFVGRSRHGLFLVGRQTEGKRLRSKLPALNERLRARRVAGGNTLVEFVRQHLEGHIQSYGVSGNTRRVTSYVYFASRLLFKWLNRRSQSRSLTWDPRGHCPLSSPGANPAPPLSRAAVEHPDWEPDGVTLQVRFCEGPGTRCRMVE